jgi:maltose alpha-D-glucosyltransferase/alpha-amylase
MQKKALKNVLEGDSLWYKDAILYELHVRAFNDSNADGMGDFRGLTEKLDYLEDLGVTAVWLLPFFPSPWKDDGYDIADFRDVHPAYGNLRDFQVFLKEAHRRGIRVITELVINHTSDQHTWFQRSRRAAPGSRWRNFYVWSDTPDKYTGARIIFKDFEASNWTWDPVAKAYFWHRFYSHQPDLNFDNPLVRRAVFRTIDYWADMGVDGFRLDAIPYLYEREGTTCENLPETHEFLKDLRRHLDETYPNRMLLAEANMWPEDAVAYFQDGSACHMAFHFPLMPRMFMALRLEDRFPIVEILRRTPAIPENCQWALFLRNHDELTLEMVTDEERDYMYRVYASDQRSRINLGIRRRLAPLLDNDRPRIELMNGMLFALPGTPVLYYGDEIGMGDNIYLGDRNGMRTPMQWSPDRNAGFSYANPQQLYLPVNIDPAYHYETINVEAQRSNPQSLLSWTKRLIALRKQYKAFGRGTLEFLQASNHRIVAFVRRYQNETILVVANLSRFAQPASLNLSEFADLTLVEMFGRTEFPPITEAPYTLTMGPSSFFWFALERRHVREEIVAASNEPDIEQQLPLVAVSSAEAIWQDESRLVLARSLAAFAARQQWYLGAHRQVRTPSFYGLLTLSPGRFYIVLLHLEYREGDPVVYAIPISLQTEPAGCAIAKVRIGSSAFILSEASEDPEFAGILFDIISKRKRVTGERGILIGQHNRWFRTMMSGLSRRLTAQPSPCGSLKTRIRFEDRFVLKLLRSVEPGDHPGVVLSRLLTETHSFPYAAPLAGTLDYQQGNKVMTLGILHGFVENEGDAWTLILRQIAGFYGAVRAGGSKLLSLVETARPDVFFSLDAILSEEPDELSQMLDDSPKDAGRIGAELAEMHGVLARDNADAALAPERYNDFYRQSLYHSMLRLLSRRFEFLRQHYSELPDGVRDLVVQVLDSEDQINARFRLIYELRIQAVRTRYHGLMGLEHILCSKDRFTFIDFEGDPVRHLSERSIKRTPLRDVASLIHSFAHALQVAMLREGADPQHGVFTPNQLRNISAVWYTRTTSALIRSYWHTAEPYKFLPPTREQQEALLNVHLLERALLDIRPLFLRYRELVPVPLRIILLVLGVPLPKMAESPELTEKL